jgi:hypothetical protein
LPFRGCTLLGNRELSRQSPQIRVGNFNDLRDAWGTYFARCAVALVQCVQRWA